jgi:hypothetical protein
MIGDKYVKPVLDKDDDVWVVGSRGFFLNKGIKCTNPDHETLVANGYVYEEPGPVEETTPAPPTDESMWRSWMNSISWNKDLTWGAPE